jgi:predicted AAA+ superfamily ATPase
MWEDLAEDKSMVFVAGPRQSGKTTFARMISDAFSNSLYWNWDIAEHRTRFIDNPIFFEAVERKDSSIPLIIFDELHKYKDWKNYLKGVYDQFYKDYQFLVSGSGRLDIYQKGGDSLAGRYLLFHLWPFTIAELIDNERTIGDFLIDPLMAPETDPEETHELWARLSKFSGFPEPYLAGRTRTYRRWSNTYSQQLIREDIRDLTGIKSLGDLETLYYLLPSRVGSPLSVPSLAQDLRVSYNSVRSWIAVFERFFLVFSIGPWTKKISRAIQKERKVYLWDVPRIEDASALFENMVAIELWRAITGWNDMGYGSFSLHFIKNKEQQEVDFLVAERGNPLFLIEAKLTDTEPSPVLKKFQAALNVPAIQLTKENDTHRLLSNGNQKILVIPACQWLSMLP